MSEPIDYDDLESLFHRLECNGTTSYNIAQQIRVAIATLREQVAAKDIRFDAHTSVLQLRAEKAEAENAALRDALQHIAEPLAWEQDHLEPGYKINGPMMISILDQPSYYREIARAALLAGKEKKTE